MARLIYLSLLLCLTACAGSSFTGGNAPNPPPAQSPTADEATPEPETSADAQPDEAQEASIDNTISLCQAALKGEETSVINLTQGDADLSDLPDDAIVLFDVTGQAEIDLTQEEVSALGGVCIAAAGQSTIKVDLSATVATFYYFARGEASTNLIFGDSGTLAELATDISGSSSLDITGDQIDCSSLEYQGGGSSVVTCNGESLTAP